MIFEGLDPDGATPLDSDDVEGLIPPLSSRAALNTFESANILTAIEWARRSRRLKRELVSVASLKLLHEKMFDRTWSWAGQFRKIRILE